MICNASLYDIMIYHYKGILMFMESVWPPSGGAIFRGQGLYWIIDLEHQSSHDIGPYAHCCWYL